MALTDLKVYLNTLRLKGQLAYEYNPLYNYLTDVDLYLVDNKYVVPVGKAVNLSNGELLDKKRSREGSEWVWVDKRGNIILDNIGIATPDVTPLYAKAGSILDFDTELLNFDLEHPVEIEVLPSYDGSVNLILNDDKNYPRLINSRFSSKEKNTYEIIDRIGENDTNIYNSKSFDKDTSLYFLYEKNPNIEYRDFIKGDLPVGQYCFYFTYCDSDENESDFIAETGLIPVFIGSDNDPKSIDGGIKNLSSNKGIKLRINNLDKSYNYIKVYYVRYFADYNLNRIYECKKIYKKYYINNSYLYLQITGYEEAEDIDANILNITRFNPKSVLTLALCKNMLFFGNVVKNSDNYKELSDCALRIYPSLEILSIKDIDLNYESLEGDYAYYKSLNIYNKTGYFNKEYYRFGIVFIYNNGTLSNVYNTIGGTLKRTNELVPNKLTLFTNNGAFLVRNYFKIDEDGWILKDDKNGYNGDFVNSKGVCKIDVEDLKPNEIIGIKFKFDKDTIEFLQNDLNIRGFFIVRQKCIPSIITQCTILPMDEVLEAPVISSGENLVSAECFLDKEDRTLTNAYERRLYKYSTESNSIGKFSYAAICPDFLLNQPYYNLIFNGSKFRLEKVYDGKVLYDLERFYKISPLNTSNTGTTERVTLCTVTEDVLTVALESKVYRLEIGKTEEAYRFGYVDIDKSSDENASEATNLVRGKYSPYLAVYSPQSLTYNSIYNIYVDNSISEKQEYINRMDSYEPFYAIGLRKNFNDLAEDLLETCWRGDCYLNTFTYRLNRNFNDPSLPNNDKIIDKNTWKDNYLIDLPEKWTDISTSDVNAVQLGSWITFKVRSAMNYALRSIDHSYVAEEALMGAPRSFYPRSLLLWRGENKLPDSYLYNDAYRASLGFKCYFTLRDVNYIKDTFSNRILYSAIAILDSFKNNYRYSLSTYFRDYSQEYGSIQKLVGFEGYLLVVFEHAIGIAVVNERVLAGGGDGEPVFINTLNVLPEELTIITDTYGTQWGDSVVKSEAGYVYGIDTVAKKIWRVKGQQIEILSDFKVNKFLVDNITLSERETTPTIGLRNVKTHYNNNKKDIIFTFYDDRYKDEENAWSLCYNELLGAFVTFYSWIPSFSENIDTKFFTFNRNTAKGLSLLLKCNYAIPENSGILVDSPVIKKENGQYLYPKLYYSTSLNTVYYTIYNEDGTTSMKLFTGDETLLEGIKFKLEPDHWHNNEKFQIINNTICPKDLTDELFEELFNELKIVFLYVTPYIENTSSVVTETVSNTVFRSETVALTLDSIVTNPLLTLEEKSRAGLTTDFYLHGQAGIFNVAENLYPTYWYGEYHPFEFEFVVNDKVGLQKVFTDLIMISNKAEPESFHFEIEGDNYEFSSDKRNMYFRQEATKNLYLNLGSDIIYNRYYTDVAADKYTYELYYRGNPIRRNGGNNVSFEEYTQLYANLDRVYPIDSLGLTLQVKSTIFPLYYEKVDTFNNIYHDYIMMHDDDGVYDFLNLSGSEISWNRDLNQFNIITHIKNRPIDLVGRLRGNSRYKEGKWHIQIPTISFMLKNEDDWPTLKDMPQALKDEGPLANRDSSIKVPPIVINSQNVPNNVDFDSISNIISNSTGCEGGYVEGSSWSNRKETRIRDKWMKIRVRYSGKNLAIIHSLTTLYNLSYS